MIKKLKNYLVVVASLLTLAMPALVPATTAGAIDLNNCVGNGATDFQLKNECSENKGQATFSQSSLNNIIQTVVKWFSIIVGVIAVIMIIVGGLRYITSGGDSNKISGAKNTIIFALIGLIIVALAQVIVHFVLNNAVSQTT